MVVLCVLFMVSGCAERTNRGGFADWAQDIAIYKADTKHLRIIRSYVMVAALTRVAAKAPIFNNERFEVATKIRTATILINEAYGCAGALPKNGIFNASNPGSRVRDTAGCAFFDDIMSQLDSTILRLARATFLNEENKDLLALLKKEIGQTDPVFDKAFDAVASASELADTGAKLLTKEGAIITGVSALVRLGFNAFQAGSRLAPIYRDSIELQMQIALDFLNLSCVDDNYPSFCSHRKDLEKAYANGAGDMSTWKGILEPFFDDRAVKSIIIPRPEHFQDVTDLLASACKQLVGRDVYACFPSAESMWCDLVKSNGTEIVDSVAVYFEQKGNGKKCYPVDKALRKNLKELPLAQQEPSKQQQTSDPKPVPAVETPKPNQPNPPTSAPRASPPPPTATPSATNIPPKPDEPKKAP